MQRTIEWTPEQFARLEEMWAAGTSARDIGMALGISRNAVLGKVHRKKLPTRKGIRKEPKPKAPRQRKSKPIAVQETAANPVTIADLTHRTCRFPLWGPEASGGLYCGSRPTAFSPYCAEHSRRCFNRSPKPIKTIPLKWSRFA